MYTSFRVTNFRCFRDLTVDRLAKINLISGRNDAGKTTLLEAIWIHHGSENPNLPFRIQGWRGISTFSSDELLANVWTDLDTSQPIELSSDNEYGETKKVTVRQELSGFAPTEVQPTPPPPGEDEELDILSVGAKPSGVDAESTHGMVAALDVITEEGASRSTARALMINGEMKVDAMPKAGRPTGVLMTAANWTGPEEQAKRFTAAVQLGYKEKLVRMLSQVDERITDLELLTPVGVTLVHAHIGLPQALALGLMGAGLHRLLTIGLGFFRVKGGVLLIDELENEMHHSILEHIWQTIWSLSEDLNVQVFATSHSYECIRAARNVFGESSPGEFLYHRLDRRGGAITVKTYDCELLGTALETELELRG